MIREAKPSDTDRLITIWLEASIQAHDFIAPAFWKSKVNDMRTIYLPAAETYVFEEKGIVKGFVSLLGDTVAALFVAPNCQGAGVGKQLLSKAKEIRTKLTLTVYKENTKSVGFYEACGFRVIKEQADCHTRRLELLMEFNT